MSTRFGNLARTLLCTTVTLAPACIGDGASDCGGRTGDEQVTPCTATDPESVPTDEQATATPLKVQPREDPCIACGSAFVDTRGRRFLELFAR